MENYASESQNKVNAMRIADWLILYLILLVPVVNIVMLFVWALDDSARYITRKRWAIANLILIGIVITLYLFFFLIIGIGAMFNY